MRVMHVGEMRVMHVGDGEMGEERVMSGFLGESSWLISREQRVDLKGVAG